MICLDEPTAGVAQREAEAFGPLILRIQDELDATLVVVEHDMPLILSLSDRVYCLEAGRVIAEGARHGARQSRVVASYLGTDDRAIQRSNAAASRSIRKKERPMAKYLALFSYSGDAMAAMIARPAEREPAVRAVLESVGARLEAFYWMFGAHDGLAIVEAPDSLTMAGISTTMRSTGTMPSETHELFTGEDVERILNVREQGARPRRRSVGVGHAAGAAPPAEYHHAP